MGVTHTSRPCVGNPGWGGEGQRLIMGWRDLKFKTWDEEERVRGLHSNDCLYEGSQRPGSPTLTLSASELGGDWAHETLPSFPHAPRNQWWGCSRGRWASLLLTLPATWKCGEGEPPPLFQREAQRGQVASPKLCRTARTRTQDVRLPKVRAAAAVLQCPLMGGGSEIQ